MAEANDEGANLDKKPQEEKPAEKKELTMAEIAAAGEEGKPKGEPKLVPEAALVKEKKGRQEAERLAAKLQKQIDDGAASPEDVADGIDDLNAMAEEFDVDPKLLTKLTKSIETKARKAAEAATEAGLEPLKAADRASKINQVFSEHFEAAMAEMPEFKDVVNKEVIKTLSLDPKNANKSFRQIIEDTYSGALGGKRTLEQKQPNGGKGPDEIDYDKAQRDGKYFGEIMADPVSKKKYNDGLAQRISKHL